MKCVIEYVSAEMCYLCFQTEIEFCLKIHIITF